MSVNRRIVVKGAAWTVPVVAMAAAAPAAATSGGGPVVDGVSLAGKCPGQSTDANWTTVITVTLTDSADSFTVPSVTLNGQTYANPCTMVASADRTVWYVVLPSTNSANGSGNGSFVYVTSANGHTNSGTGAIAYDGTHPLAKSVCEVAATC